LSSRRRKRTTSCWEAAVVCCGRADECAVDGEGLEEVCGDWWVGIRAVHAGKADALVAERCYECHQPVKDRDFLFTRYAR
jgi:hypothetical protein